MRFIINDWTFLIKNGLITEAKYDNELKRLKVGDDVQYVDKSGDKLNFEVIFNDNGQVYLKNVDSGVYKNNYFFINISSLVGDDIKFRTININKNLPANLKDADDNIKLAEIKKKFPVDTWKTSSFKALDKILMRGINIDLVKTSADDSKYKSYKKVSDISELINEFKGYSIGKQYKFILNNGGFLLDLIGKDNDSLLFYCSNVIGDAKNKYNKLIGFDLRLDLDAAHIEQRVSSLDGDENVDSIYNLKFKKYDGGEGKDDDASFENVLVKNVVDFEMTGIVKPKDDEEKEEKKGEKEEEEEPKIDITDDVLNNPKFKELWINEPGILKKMVGYKAKGFLPAEEIFKSLHRYADYYNKVKVSNNIVNNKYYYVTIKGEIYDAETNSDLRSGYNYLTQARRVKDIDGDYLTTLKGRLENDVDFKVKVNWSEDDKEGGEEQNKYRVTVFFGENEKGYNRTATIKLKD